MKEEGIIEHLAYDPTPRGALIEHFLAQDASLEEFKQGLHRELGADFLLQAAEVNIERLELPAKAPITHLPAPARSRRPELLLEKTIVLFAGADSLQVDYRLTNRGHGEAALHFAVEFNLAFLGGYDEGRYYRIPGRRLSEAHLASMGSEEEVGELALVDRWRGLELNFSFGQPALLWRLPVETVSLSEGGLERAYQQSLLLPRWDFSLAPGESKEINFTLQLAPLEQEAPAEARGEPSAGREGEREGKREESVSRA